MAKKDLILKVVEKWASINGVSFETLREDLVMGLDSIADLYWIPFTDNNLDQLVEAWNVLVIDENDDYDEYFLGTRDYYVRKDAVTSSYYSEDKGIGFFVFKKM